MSTKLYYIGAGNTSRHPGQYHQYDDVTKVLTVIPCADSGKIRYCLGEIHKSIHNAAVIDGCLRYTLYFCGQIGCLY